MAKQKKVTINLYPFDVEMMDTNEGFGLRISGATNKGKGQLHEIHIYFDSWWIKLFLKQFRSILEYKRELLDEFESGFNKTEK
jgi:hypothetical protein